MRYAIQRFWATLLTLAAAFVIVFFIVHLVPGDPAAIMLSDLSADRQAVEDLRRDLGLDRPLPEQFLRYLSRAVTGDLGFSYRSQRPVVGEIAAIYHQTLLLALGGILFAVLIGIPAGFFSAAYRNSWLDRFCMIGALSGISMPVFWLGILLIIFFSFQLRLFPTIGVGDPADPLDMLWHLVLPALSLGLRGAALIARVTRSSFLEILGQDYIRTGRMKGLSEVAVKGKHAFRNALLPIVTVIGLDLGQLLGGTTVTEIVFSRPGMGTLLIESVLARDYPMVQGTMLVYLLVIILVNLLVDLAYGLVDPRIRYG